MSQVPHDSEPYASPASTNDARPRRAESTTLILRTIKCLAGLGFVLLLLIAFDVIDITYRRYRENDPLTNSVLAARTDQGTLELADGRRIKDTFIDADEFRRSDRMVEIVPDAGGADFVDIYGKRIVSRCRIRAWEPIVSLPLVPIDVPRYERTHLGDGRLSRTTDQVSRETERSPLVSLSPGE